MYDNEEIKNDLTKSLELMCVTNEGFSEKPYRCPNGYLTIGYGRNLDTCGITPSEALTMLRNDISCVYDLCDKLPLLTKLSKVWKLVYMDMVFNMGKDKVAEFKGMNKALESEDYFMALVELIDSAWFFEVGYRAKRAICALYYANEKWLYEQRIEVLDRSSYDVLDGVISRLLRMNHIVPKRLFQAKGEVYDKLGK